MLDVVLCMLSIAQLDAIASQAVLESSRPRGSGVLVVAASLGFELLPFGKCNPEPERTSAVCLVFGALAESAEERTWRVWLALARGLLLRQALDHEPPDVVRLAERLCALFGHPAS